MGSVVGSGSGERIVVVCAVSTGGVSIAVVCTGALEMIGVDVLVP